MESLHWLAVSKFSLQMKQLCAVLTGMQVSHNYEQGQQLLQSREFNTRKAFFQTVLEIGRRYKILNPERMRDSYGKLMYFLQDSRKPEVRDLLEFDIVSGVRSVWDVLKRSPKGAELLEDPQLKTATMEIMSEGKGRSQVQREIKQKEAAIKHLSSKYCSVARRRKRHYGGIYSTWSLLRSSYRDSDSEEGNDGDELSEDVVEQCIYSLGDHSTYLRLKGKETRELDSKAVQPAVPPSAVTSFTGGLPMAQDPAFDLRQSFRKFPLHRQVQLGLMKMGLSVPTRVQDMTLPMLLEGISTFILAQTGTGKTLAYVLPIVHKLLTTNTEGLVFFFCTTCLEQMGI
eukprot:s1016_g19.t1